jgi:uncharacterized protein YggE
MSKPLTVERLRKTNIYAGLLHLVQMIAVLALSSDFSLPITATYMSGPRSVIDQLVSKAGNNLQINAISSYISDPTAATPAARADVIAKAKAKAQAYAKLIDHELGDVIAINEDNSQMQPVPMPMAKESAGNTSFDMGLSKASVSLYITYELD